MRQLCHRVLVARVASESNAPWGLLDRLQQASEWLRDTPIAAVWNGSRVPWIIIIIPDVASYRVHIPPHNLATYLPNRTDLSNVN